MIRFNKLIKPIKNGSLERYLNKIGSISICELGWTKSGHAVIMNKRDLEYETLKRGSHKINEI